MKLDGFAVEKIFQKELKADFCSPPEIIHDFSPKIDRKGAKLVDRPHLAAM